MQLTAYPLDRLGLISSAKKESQVDTNNLIYPKLLELFPKYLAPKRSESASFLMWYLENYYRLDEFEVGEIVCDNRGDKGIDAIFVNDDDKTITVFQMQISQSPDRTIGDASLRAFAGTLTQFRDAESINTCMTSAGNAPVATLMKRLDLTTKIVAGYQVRGEFISNIEVDVNGDKFLKNSNITFVGPKALIEHYISDRRDVPVMKLGNL